MFGSVSDGSRPDLAYEVAEGGQRRELAVGE